MTHREAKGLLASVKIRSQDIKQFYIHLATYLVASTFFIMLNATQGPDAPVAILPIFFWGVILLRHSFKVFGWKGKKTKEWEKEFLVELMDGQPLPGEEGKALPAHEELNVLRLKKRIENLEAIISSGKWDEMEVAEKELLLAEKVPNEAN